MVYDPLGRLVWTRRPDGANPPIDEIWSWSSWTLLAREVFQSSTLVETFRYTWGPDLSGSLEGAGGVGGLLAVERAAGSSSTWQIRHVHSDANGNVLALSTDTGTASARYRYSPFGETISSQDLDGSGWAVKNVHRFSTKPEIAGTGLYYYGYRYYDPLTGRWPSRDPIGERGGINLYGFVRNSGVNRFDRLGLVGSITIPGSSQGWGSGPSTPYKPPTSSDGLSYPEGADHYYNGSGAPLTVPFSEVDPGWVVKDFIDPCSYDYGSHPIDTSKPHELFNDTDSFTHNAGPGRIAIKLVGTLTVTKEQTSDGGCKKWSFSGSQSAPSDEFDFESRPWGERDPEAGFHMGPFGNPVVNVPWREVVTRLINLGGGDNFTVNFTGDKTTNENGECSK